MEGLEKLTGKQVVDYFTNKIAEERNIPKLLARKMVVTVIADEIKAIPHKPLKIRKKNGII